MEKKIFIREIDASEGTNVIIFTSEEPAKGITMKYEFLHWVREYMAKMIPGEPISFMKQLEPTCLVLLQS